VSIAVHAGELVVVQGGVASGAASLVAAIVGSRRLGAGERHASRGLQIRRGQIDEASLRSLQAAWTHGGAKPALREQETNVLYVLRVRRTIDTTDVPPAARDAAWRGWGAQLRQRGGSVLVHVATALSHSPSFSAPSRSRRVSEARPTTLDVSDEASAVRVLTLVAGRIVTSGPATRPSWLP
jgi:hypothetical protein